MLVSPILTSITITHYLTMININFNVSSIEEFDSLVAQLTQRGFKDAISTPVTLSPTVHKVGSNPHLEANKAILAQRGLQRTPKVRDAELPLRAKHEAENGATDWNNLQTRIDAMTAQGYDIFSGVALPDAGEPSASLEGVDVSVLEEVTPEDLG